MALFQMVIRPPFVSSPAEIWEVLKRAQPSIMRSHVPAHLELQWQQMKSVQSNTQIPDHATTTRFLKMLASIWEWWTSLLADLFGSRLIVVLVHFRAGLYSMEFFYEPPPPPSNVMSESVPHHHHQNGSHRQKQQHFFRPLLKMQCIW